MLSAFYWVIHVPTKKCEGPFRSLDAAHAWLHETAERMIGDYVVAVEGED